MQALRWHDWAWCSDWVVRWFVFGSATEGRRRKTPPLRLRHPDTHLLWCYTNTVIDGPIAMQWCRCVGVEKFVERACFCPILGPHVFIIIKHFVIVLYPSREIALSVFCVIWFHHILILRWLLNTWIICRSLELWRCALIDLLAWLWLISINSLCFACYRAWCGRFNDVMCRIEVMKNCFMLT